MQTSTPPSLPQTGSDPLTALLLGLALLAAGVTCVILAVRRRRA